MPDGYLHVVQHKENVRCHRADTFVSVDERMILDDVEQVGRGHLAEIGDGFKAGIGVAELLQDFVFDAGGNDLGVGAAAVEDGGGGTQKRARWKR